MITIIQAGIYTTIQDTGRFSGAHLGIPCSGYMDSQSAELANLMLGNSLNSAMLECTFVGPTIKFHQPTIIAITGAHAPTFVNNIEINRSIPLQIKIDDVLSFGKFEKGCRIYIAIAGGLQSEVIYGSRSTCYTAGILKPLKKGDQIHYTPTLNPPETTISIKYAFNNSTLLAYKGPEFSILNTLQRENISKTKFRILPSSNRMAYRVSHNINLTHSYSMLSSGTIPGTIQLTASGEMIFLMRDCQTTGGYPRILQLSEQSICDLGQLMPSQNFSLKLEF